MPGGVLVSEDNLTGDFRWRLMTRLDGTWPSGFIHYPASDGSPSGEFTSVSSPEAGTLDFWGSSMIETFAPNDRPIVTSIVTTLSQTFTNERSDERIAVGGTANLVRFGADFDLSIKPVLEAIEEQVVLLKLLGEASSPSRLMVRIGHENGYEGLSGT